MRLILVRHAQTPANVQRALESRVPGPGLTELGHQQARELPEQLAGERIGAIFVSSMVRTHLTAAPLATALGMTPVERDGLREIAAGDLEGRTDDEAVETYLDTVFSWEADPHRRMPGGESGTEFFARVDAVVSEAQALASERNLDTVAFVSHGATLRLWTQARCHNLQTSNRYPLANTGTIVVERSGESWRCTSWTGQPISDLGVGAPVGPTGQRHPA